MSLTHYGTLGVDRTSTFEEIKAAYRALASQHHPDRGGEHDVMASITVAYEVIGDPDRREAYEEALQLMATPCPVCGGEGRRYKQKGFTARVAKTCEPCKGEGVAHVDNVVNVVRMGGTTAARRKRK